jgi:hypothetical protein
MFTTISKTKHKKSFSLGNIILQSIYMSSSRPMASFITLENHAQRVSITVFVAIFIRVAKNIDR